jgi:hypothetical protein
MSVTVLSAAGRRPLKVAATLPPGLVIMPLP